MDHREPDCTSTNSQYLRALIKDRNLIPTLINLDEETNDPTRLANVSPLISRLPLEKVGLCRESSLSSLKNHQQVSTNRSTTVKSNSHQKPKLKSNMLTTRNQT
jgi:hypothetical protein